VVHLGVPSVFIPQKYTFAFSLSWFAREQEGWLATQWILVPHMLALIMTSLTHCWAKWQQTWLCFHDSPVWIFNKRDEHL